jgi:dsRNA-specific ribonuclease
MCCRKLDFNPAVVSDSGGESIVLKYILFTRIGEVYRRETEQDKAAIFSVVNEIIGQPFDMQTVQDGVPENSNQQQTVLSSGYDGIGGQDSPGSDNDEQYTTALKEHGDRIKTKPDYFIPSQIIKNGTPHFVATVQFRGVIGRGWGRTKRAAKHRASKDAWRRLGKSLS